MTAAPAVAAPQSRAAVAAQPIAHYRDGDREMTITRGDVALEMAFDQRRRDQGRDAVDHLVATQLVRQEAERQGLWPSDADVRALWRELSRQLEARGRDPLQEPIVKNSGLDRFLEDLALQLAHEKLVRAQLGMRADEDVGGEMLKLWVAEARKRIPVVTDPDELPVGSALRVGGKDVTLLELGLLLLRISEQDEIDRFIRQVVVLDRIEALALQEGVTVTPEDIEREIRAQQAVAARDPRFRGMSLEQLLKSQGITLDWLRQSRVFRAQLLQKKIVARQHPREDLMAEIGADRQAVLDRAGPRRRLGVVFVRALAEPNELVPRDFAAAREHLLGVKSRLATEDFEHVARIETESAAGKLRGGDLGWFQRRDDQLPEPVLEAAFALEPGALSEPIAGPEGCYLVKLLDVEPAPTDDELVTRMREQLVREMTQQLLRECEITRADGTRLDTAQDGAR